MQQKELVKMCLHSGTAVFKMLIMSKEIGITISVPVTTTELTFTVKDSFGDGYDSEGELGPFYDAVLDEPSE
jgi:hypothetical protein